MSENRNEKLDAMLRARNVEPASQDLAQRIILKAQSLPQNKTIPLWQSIKQLCAEFHLPKPAYVLASALLLGMVIGFSTPQDNNADNNDDIASMQNIFSADEAPL